MIDIDPGGPMAGLNSKQSTARWSRSLIGVKVVHDTRYIA